MASAPTPADLELAAQTAARPLPWLSAEARDRLARVDWSEGTVEEGGQFHRVLVVAGQGVLRMTRTPQAAGLLPRRVVGRGHGISSLAGMPDSLDQRGSGRKGEGGNPPARRRFMP